MDPNLTEYYVTICQITPILNSQPRITFVRPIPVIWSPEDASAAPPTNTISNLYEKYGTVSAKMSRTLLGPASEPPWEPPPESLNFDALVSDLPTTGVQYNNIIYTDGSTLDSIDNFLLTITPNIFFIGDVSDFIPGFPPGTDCFVLPDMPYFISFPCASTISSTQILTPSATIIAGDGVNPPILTGPITISGKPDFTFKTGNYEEFDDWLYIIRSPKLVNYTRGVWYFIPIGSFSPPFDPVANLTFNFNQTFGYKITADLGTSVVDGSTYRTFQTDDFINYTLPYYGQGERPAFWMWLYNDNDPTGNNMLLPKITLYKPFLSSQDITTGYYNCYTPQWWLNCVNNALAKSWQIVPQSLRNMANTPRFVPTASGGIELLTPIITDTRGRKIGFACNPNQVTGDGSKPIYLNGTGNTISVRFALFMNEPLYNLFSSFNGVYYGSNFVSINTALLNASPFVGDGIDDEKAFYFPDTFNYYIQPINYNGLNVEYVSPTLSYVVTRSEYSPIPMWSPIQSIRFSSSLLPNINSYTCLPIPFNKYGVSTQTQQSVGGNNSQMSNAITDIQVALTTGFEYKPTVSYVPKGEYRLIDLLGECPIQSVDFIVSWVDKYGAEIPFRLGSQCSANLKLLFRSKRFNYADFDDDFDEDD
jgi:hypothetical protein